MSRRSSAALCGSSSRLIRDRRPSTRLRRVLSANSGNSWTTEWSMLKPLVLRDVAMDIGMHESTVSRVVSNKYMHTPQGVCEMKYFFHSGICQHLWRERLVGHDKTKNQENSRGRKSEEAAFRFEDREDSRREGLVLARRTIAKYREELRIPPSNQRKNFTAVPLLPNVHLYLSNGYLTTNKACLREEVRHCWIASWDPARNADGHRTNRA